MKMTMYTGHQTMKPTTMIPGQKIHIVTITTLLISDIMTIMTTHTMPTGNTTPFLTSLHIMIIIIMMTGKTIQMKTGKTGKMTGKWIGMNGR
jgi:uncharacterized membrane protein SirB2